MEQSIREPAVAGTFYSSDPEELRREIDAFLEKAHPPDIPKPIVGLICPHAGYAYSGSTAAFGYRAIQEKKYKRVVVFALSHRVSFRGASVFNGSGYATPLGVVKVDRDLVKGILEASSLVTTNLMAHEMEHSLEVQIPFLQTVLKEFKLVPILFRDQDLETCRKVSESVFSLIPENERKETLIVGSTDLYHGANYDECERKDALLAKTLERFDEFEFDKKVNQGEIMACGIASILSTMILGKALGAKDIKVLHRTNSSDITGFRGDYVVGYLSAALY